MLMSHTIQVLQENKSMAIFALYVSLEIKDSLFEKALTKFSQQE